MYYCAPGAIHSIQTPSTLEILCCGFDQPGPWIPLPYTWTITSQKNKASVLTASLRPSWHLYFLATVPAPNIPELFFKISASPWTLGTTNFASLLELGVNQRTELILDTRILAISLRGI